ncbi:MAG: gluconate 2-dehydrogenase subunit 3 family protein [Dehalococcoidia bacterium]|nr:gluconate 2-dehydrogenase subunit 3 family protein [Dehalococcoidia bacterium]
MTASNSYFSDSQLELVRAVLDRIVPPEADMPGAGEAALEYVDRAVGSRGDYRRLWGDGLARIEIAAWSRHKTRFIDLSRDEQEGVLTLVDAGEPHFFQSLVREAYAGYYSNPRVVALLGLEARPPQPGGHHVEQGSFDGLEKVRRRGTVWRAAGE